MPRSDLPVEDGAEPTVAPAAQLVEVHFKGNRKAFFTWAGTDEPLRLREAVLVEADRGIDFGRVSKVGEAAAKGCSACAAGSCGIGGPAPDTPVRAVLRRATQEDIRAANELRRSEEDVRRKVMERVEAHQLAMRVSDAEWQWDRRKLTVYFTAEKRVDFRALVRDLAALFRTRIELRQIGVRDEAARLGGVGRCGREYCCSTWLRDLSPVNLSLAKDQHLSLNPAQISGGCGRLLCCLKYEHEFYVAARKRFPREGKTLRTEVGLEKVVAVDIFRERVFLRSEERGPRIIPLVQLQEELALFGNLPVLEPRTKGNGAAVVRAPAAEPKPEPRPAPRAPVAEAPPIGDPAGDDPAGDGATEDDDPTAAGEASGGAGATGPRRRRRRRRRRGGRGPEPSPGGTDGR